MTAAPDPAVAEARSQVYALLAAVFDGDADLLVEAMETGVFARLAATLPDDVDVEALDGDRRENALDAAALRVGYDNLFVVPGPHYVPPFASGHAEPSEPVESDSVYRDDGAPGELLGRPAASAAATYERFDFTPSRRVDFPDSLPALLEFASALAAVEAETSVADAETGEPSVADAETGEPAAVEADAGPETDDVSALREVELTFVENQLGWVDAFAESVAEADAAEGVYAALAAFTRAFVAADRAWLAATLDTDGGGRERGRDHARSDSTA
jgi:TorA maturation chaperone TorD